VACAAQAVHPNKFSSPEAFARERWGAGPVGMVLRAASAPAMTTTPTWAGVTAHDVIGDFFASLAPMSAAASLIDAAPRVSLDRINSLKFPARSGSIDAAYLPWVGEGMPAPVLRFTFATAATIGPACKLMAIVVMTREMAESSSAEMILTTILRENVSLALDASMFSTAAATAARPAGILAGLTPLTAATGGGETAMTTDLSALAGAIGSVTNGLAYVMNPKQAHAIKITRGTTWPDDVPIWPTVGVAPGTIIALDPAAFVSAFGSDPDITSSFEATLHMEDATPQQLVTSPGVIASPQHGLFQTETLATRLRLPAAWAVRQTGAVSFITGATW
jgi:hypothetical protein